MQAGAWERSNKLRRSWRSGPSSEFAPGVFFFFFVMMVKHSCDVPNPHIRHFAQSRVGVVDGGWGGGRQDFLTGCDGQTAEREMWREESAETSLGSPAAFVTSVCESVWGCLEDVKSIMVRRSQQGLVISWESGKSSHLSKGQSVWSFFCLKFAVVGCTLPFVVDWNHRALVQIS